MAQVAFSHQFSHRWANAPLPVKGALIQELDDIVQLLDDHTDLDSFEFSTPDLHAYIDEIYINLKKEQESSNFETERLESKSLEAQQAQTDAKNKEVVIVKADNPATTAEVDHTSVKDSNIDNVEDSNNDTRAIKVLNNLGEDIDSESIHSETTPKPLTAFSIDEVQGKLDAEFVKELEARIEDYLSEQLAQMSEDLKSWVREQIANHLSDN